MGEGPTILIVGDEDEVSKSVRALGFQSVVAGHPQEALQRVKDAALVLINLPDPAVEAEFLQELSKEACPMVILTNPSLPRPTIIPRNGKVRLLPRPTRKKDLEAALHAALGATPNVCPADEVTRRAGDRYQVHYGRLVGPGPAMRTIRAIIHRVADTNATVLIRGESGVGKELVARAVHDVSGRANQPFVKVNCAALPAELLESELFGHEKGAFTGAYRRKLGKFEYANKGTLFLDEIGELHLALQAKLLHVLQDHEFSRVGGRETIRIDTRVIASTNRNLEAALTTGQFREDLYYRLNVVEIHVPALRERRDEIPGLVTYFLEKFQHQYGRQVTLPPQTMEYFEEYSWPGNVRELENIIRRLVVLGNVGQVHEEMRVRLATIQRNHPKPTGAEECFAPPPASSMGLREIARWAARDAERRAIKEVLDRVHWNRSQAARLLKISYKTLLSKIAECDLAPKRTGPKL